MTAIRARAVWFENPHQTYFDERGRPISIYGQSFCVWLDEEMKVHKKYLQRRRGRVVVPRFKLVLMPPGTALKLGEKPGDYTIVSSSILCEGTK